MRMVFGLVLVVGVALAGFSVMMAKNYIDGYQSKLAEANQLRDRIVETEAVYIATRTLKHGETLGEDDVRLISRPAAFVPEGAFLRGGDLFAEGETRPRLVMHPMVANEPVLADKVTRPGEGVGIMSRLEPGMRAFAIRVDMTSGVAGLLRPGHSVDVYWTGRLGRNPGDNERGDVTRLVEANVEILAVDQSTDFNTTTGAIARTVTIAARPEQVATLANLQTSGSLSLSLVGLNDTTEVSRIEVDQCGILGNCAGPAAPVAAPAEVCYRRERRGTEVVEIETPCSN